MVKYLWKFPQRLKDALLFIDSSSFCKYDIHFSSGCFHYVKLVILIMYLQQGGDVFTCLFVRWYKTRVMIPVKSVEGCLLSIKAETSTNRTQSCVFMCLTHRLNIKALMWNVLLLYYSATCGSKNRKTTTALHLMQKWKRPIFKSRLLILCVKDKTQIFNSKWFKCV